MLGVRVKSLAQVIATGDDSCLLLLGHTCETVSLETAFDVFETVARGLRNPGRTFKCVRPRFEFVASRGTWFLSCGARQSVWRTEIDPFQLPVYWRSIRDRIFDGFADDAGRVNTALVPFRLVSPSTTLAPLSGVQKFLDTVCPGSGYDWRQGRTEAPSYPHGFRS